MERIIPKIAEAGDIVSPTMYLDRDRALFGNGTVRRWTSEVQRWTVLETRTLTVPNPPGGMEYWPSLGSEWGRGGKNIIVLRCLDGKCAERLALHFDVWVLVSGAR